MSQAEVLLNTLTSPTATGASVPVESLITIDVDRFVHVPDSLCRLGVQHDHNIETVTISCPRYWDGHDMSQMKIYVNYMCANGEIGRHLTTNLQLIGASESGFDAMTFDWTISGHVTQAKGKISFLVCIVNTDADGNEERHWNSELNQECYISEGLECKDFILYKYPDIITDLLLRMECLENYAENIPDALPNPNSLTIDGISYDGSEAVTIYTGSGKSVRAYNAKGDGSTDDTAAFQAALKAERVTYVPGGTYKLSSELVIGDNCCLELAQDAVLNFTQTSGNCITLGMSSHLKGNHATVKIPYDFEGHVLHAYSNDHTTAEAQAVQPWSKWDPQWKSGRYVSDLNICKADSRGFHYAVNPEDCKGTAVYLSADNTSGMLTFMWGIWCSGLRIAGAFAYGIHAQNFDGGWVHEMRIDAFIDACEVGVCLEDCSHTYISAVIQPRRAYSVETVYTPYAKYGIKLVRSKNTDLSGSRVWDWNATNTLWSQDNEYQHIAMYGDCSGTILNDFVYHSQGDTRKRIYTDTKSNLDQLTILQEPVDRWFKIRNGDPYYSDGFTDRKLVTQEILDEHFSTDVVKNFTDILPSATDGDGSVFGDAGYKWGYLLGNGAFEESAYYMTTGFIPLKVGQTLYVDGISYAAYDGFCRICSYDAEKNFITVASAKNVVQGNYYYLDYTPTANGFSISLTNVVGNADVAFVRLSAYKRNVSDNPMASIDEPIEYTVEGFLADGVKVKGANVIGIPGQITPDWVATKNAVGGDMVVISEQTLTSGLWAKLQMNLQEGITYDVYINGEVYHCVATHADDGICLGNNTSLTANDYPFCIYWAGGSAISGLFYRDSSVLSYPITLKVMDHEHYVYNKMPEEYLPDYMVPLVGTTDEISPAQVAEAVLTGRPLAVTFIHGDFGRLTFNSFVHTTGLGDAVQASGVFFIDGTYIAGALIGAKSGSWSLYTSPLQTAATSS